MPQAIQSGKHALPKQDCDGPNGQSLYFLVYFFYTESEIHHGTNP